MRMLARFDGVWCWICGICSLVANSDRMRFYPTEEPTRDSKTVATGSNPSDQSYLLIFLSFKNSERSADHSRPRSLDPLPTPPTGTSQGLLRDHPLTRSSRTELPVSRFLRKLKRDASRIRVTRPSPSLLARDLKSMSSRIRCDIKSDRSTPFTKRDPQSMQPRTLKPSVSCESGEVSTTGPRRPPGTATNTAP